MLLSGCGICLGGGEGGFHPADCVTLEPFPEESELWLSRLWLGTEQPGELHVLEEGQKFKS